MRHGWTIRLATAAALIGAAAAPATVPGRAADDAAATAFRVRGYTACLRVNPLVAPGGQVNENAIEECHCAVSQVIAARGGAPLPEVDGGNARQVFAPHLESCRGGKSGADGKDPVAPEVPDEPAAGGSGGKPEVATDGPAPETAAPVGPAGAEETKPAGPAWLAWTGLPGWALWMFPIFGLLAALVLLTTRRRRPRRGDLMGPPPSLRPPPVIGDRRD